MRSGRGASVAARILRQEGAKLRSRAELDWLADELVKLATTHRRISGNEQRLEAIGAVDAIANARRGPRPYLGSFERLRAIHESQASDEVRRRALSRMAEFPNAGPVLQYYVEVASNSEGTFQDGNLAAVAVEILYTEMGLPGVAALRRLFREGAVTEFLAKRELDRIAYVEGWGELLTMRRCSLMPLRHRYRP